MQVKKLFIHRTKHRHFTEFPSVVILLKQQVPQSFERINRNSTETPRFHKIFTPGNRVKYLYFAP